MEMGEAEGRDGSGKMQSKLRAIVGLNRRRTIRQNPMRLGKKIRGALRSVIGICGGECGSSFRVNARGDVALHAVNESDYGIHFQHPVSPGPSKLLFPLHHAFAEGSGSSVE